jgi:hypothetical protein
MLVSATLDVCQRMTCRETDIQMSVARTACYSIRQPAKHRKHCRLEHFSQQVRNDSETRKITFHLMHCESGYLM